MIIEKLFLFSAKLNNIGRLLRVVLPLGLLDALFLSPIGGGYNQMIQSICVKASLFSLVPLGNCVTSYACYVCIKYHNAIIHQHILSYSLIILIAYICSV